MKLSLLLSLSSLSLYGQIPEIAPGGVVGAASYAQPVAPGSIVSIFGTNLGNATYSAPGTPWPTSLGGTSVAIGGLGAKLSYVSPGQINAEVPFEVSASALAYATVNVVVTTAAGSSAPAPVTTFISGSGLFTADGSGCGQAAALNVAADGSLSPNTRSSSAAPGDFVVLFGTGLGVPYFPPADGDPAVAAQTLGFQGSASIDGGAVSAAQYLGLAPGLVGTDQVNIQIPEGTRNGCAVPIQVYGNLSVSQTVSVSVNATRGPCADPPPQSYGTIELVKTISTGTGADGETDTLRAWFPSGPALARPAAPVQTTAPGSYTARVPAPELPSRSCPVAGYAPLSVGTISVSGPTGSATLAPSATSKTLPAGFLFGGTYNIAAAGGGGAGPFQGSVSVDPPVQVIAPAAVQNYSPNPITVSWTGAAPNSVIKVSLVYLGFPTSTSSYGYAPASAGSFTFQPVCSGNPVPMGNGVVCAFGLSEVNEIIVGQMPASALVPTIPVSGITGGVQIQWSYRNIFGVN